MWSVCLCVCVCVCVHVRACVDWGVMQMCVKYVCVQRYYKYVHISTHSLIPRLLCMRAWIETNNFMA